MEEKEDRLWKARPYREGDEKFLPDLYEIAMGRQIHLRSWKWQFKANPAGHGYIWFADHEGILAGQYAIIPIKMYIQGKLICATQSLDTMTHPGYRKQGIFITLARAAYEDAQSGGIELIYGFPNDNSWHGFMKHLDFFVLENLNAMTRPLNIAEVLRLKIKNRIISNAIGTLVQFIFKRLYSAYLKSDRDVRIEKASRFPEEVNKLFRHLAPKFKNLIVRDCNYLDWRYVRKPRHSYYIYLGYRGNTLQGYCVCGSTERKNIKVGLIMDLFAAPDDEVLVASLIRYALKNMAMENMMLASCVLTSRSPFLKTLKRLGFIFSLKSFPYILRINSSKLEPGTIQKIEDWHITFGDADFV